MIPGTITRMFWVYIQVRYLISCQIRGFFSYIRYCHFGLLKLPWNINIQNFRKIFKAILRTKQTSFLGQNLVKMSHFWVIRAFLLYSCSQLCFLIVHYHPTKFQKNPIDRVPRTKWTNWAKFRVKCPILWWIRVSLKIFIIFTYILILTYHQKRFQKKSFDSI